MRTKAPVQGVPPKTVRSRSFYAWIPTRIPWDCTTAGYWVWMERVTVNEMMGYYRYWRITSEVL